MHRPIVASCQQITRDATFIMLNDFELRQMLPKTSEHLRNFGEQQLSIVATWLSEIFLRMWEIFQGIRVQRNSTVEWS